MKLEDFKKLEETEQSALLNTIDSITKNNEDLEVERDSLKAENEKFKTDLAAASEELKKTKELNFTLARKVDTKKQTDPIEVLHNFIKGD